MILETNTSISGGQELLPRIPCLRLPDKDSQRSVCKSFGGNSRTAYAKPFERDFRLRRGGRHHHRDRLHRSIRTCNLCTDASSAARAIAADMLEASAIFFPAISTAVP